MTAPVRRPTGSEPSAASLEPVPMPDPVSTPATEPIPVDRDGTA